MKLKQQPEDFQVEELTSVAPTDQGPYAFYRLEKRGWSTPDALQAIRRRWRIEPRRLSYGGLKDRHAHTIQYLTIFHGPQRKLTHHGVQVEYLGHVSAPYTAKAIEANRFRITVRHLTAGQVAAAEAALAEVRVDGVPNYFDDQRFGSVARGGDFVARRMVLGQYEDALRLALTAPYQHDRGPQKKEKALLRTHWGDWATCRDQLPRGHSRSLVDYLANHPADFRGALARLRPELRGLYLSAYQSHLWNRMLALWLRQHLEPDQLVHVSLALGALPMHRRLEEARRQEFRAVSLPLPSARLHLAPDDARFPLVNAVLQDEGLELGQLKLKGLPDLYFSKGDRPVLCFPERLTHETELDELNPGRTRLVLAFDLPRGSYATLVLKRIGCERKAGRE